MPLTQATEAAQTAVATQRARIEALISAQRTQDQEEALWSERVTAAQTALDDANTAEDVADAAVTEAGKHVTDRSWLFETAMYVDANTYDTGCNAAGNAQCMLAETAFTTTTSTWTWPTNCNYSVTVGLSTTAKTCTILGLKKDASTGLIPLATTYKGVATVTGASPVTATGLTDTYEKADYSFDQAGGTTKLATALSTYLAW